MGTLNIEKKFIFIHIPKCAGLSMDMALGGYTGHQDIHEFKFMVNHNIISGVEWRDIKTFSFVRNPYDRFVSLYRHYIMRGLYEGSFEKFADEFHSIPYRDERHRYIRPQHSFICDPYNHNIQVQLLGKVENIEEDWKKAMDFIDLPGTKLPHINKSDTTIQAEYTPEIREKVQDFYSLDFEIFNYNLEF